MKKFLLNSLALGVCINLFVGCSSVKPAQKQPAVAVTPSVQNERCVAHNSLMRGFVRGWLEGNAPPPDVTEQDKTGIASCLGAAYYASVVGLLIAQGIQK
jgi:hypothetical protein